MQAYQSLDKRVQIAVQIAGLVVLLAGVGFLLVVEVFQEMPGIYGLYCAGAIIVGFIMLVPALGFWLFDRFVAALGKLLPGRNLGRPDRRGEP